jgi:hypothetical protein
MLKYFSYFVYVFMFPSFVFAELDLAYKPQLHLYSFLKFGAHTLTFDEAEFKEDIYYGQLSNLGFELESPYAESWNIGAYLEYQLLSLYSRNTYTQHQSFLTSTGPLIRFLYPIPKFKKQIILFISLRMGLGASVSFIISPLMQGDISTGVRWFLSRWLGIFGEYRYSTQYFIGNIQRDYEFKGFRLTQAFVLGFSTNY